MPITPHIKSFLIADSVFPQATGKWCIIGVFNRIMAPKFPCLHHSLGLFIELSDAEGDYDIGVDFCTSKDQVLSQIRGRKLIVKDRLTSTGFGIQTSNLPIPSPGRYFFKLYFNREIVPADIAIDAVQMENPP